MLSKKVHVLVFYPLLNWKMHGETMKFESGMSCSPAVMYSVCKPDISETSISEPVFALLAIISSEHIQQWIWKKLAHCKVLFVAVRMFTKHTMFSLLFLSVKFHHNQPQQVMDFDLFLLALYLLWNNFLISEMTSLHMNNTTTPCQPQSVHSLVLLIA